MTPQDLKQIEELLDKKFTDFRQEVELIVGNNGEKILDAMNIATVSKDEWNNLEERVSRIEEELQTA